MNFLKNTFNNLTGNFSVKCEYCRKKLNKKDAHTEKVKMLEFVYPKLTYFCSKSCCENYKNYEKSSPKKASLCPSCPVPPALIEKNKV